MKQYFNLSIIFILTSILLLTGCWDQRLLRDHTLVLSIGYDREDETYIKNTVTFPTETNEMSEIEKADSSDSNSLSSLGHTAKDAEKKMDKRIAQKFDRSKARVIVFGKELAEEGIFSTLDSIYRDLRGPLNANIAVYDGKAEEALNINSEQAPMVSDIYAELLKSADSAGITKNENVQMACPAILSTGEDIVLPYIGLDENTNEASIKGVALFFHDEMTGSLNVHETTMFLVLSDQLAKHTELNFQVNENKDDPNKEFVNFNVRKNKRKIDIETTNDTVKSNIDITLDLEINEFADDNLNSHEKATKLEKKIESHLTDLSQIIISKLQKANSDALGIGERVNAYHHDTWENIDWMDTYPDIDMDADIHVNLIRHGIIN